VSSSFFSKAFDLQSFVALISMKLYPTYACFIQPNCRPVSCWYTIVSCTVYLLDLLDNFCSASPMRKRKAVAVVDSDSSDVYASPFQFCSPSQCRFLSSEILEQLPVPSKKRARKALPPPGSPAFELLPPVSITYEVHSCIDIFTPDTSYHRCELDAATIDPVVPAGLSSVPTS
jgi:hypothetical protein